MSLSRLLPLLWIAAFLCGLFFIGGWQLELFGAAVALALGFAALSAARGVKDGWSVPKSPVLALAGTFWLLVLMSVFWSEVPAVSLMGLCFFSVFPLTFFAFVLHGDERGMKMCARVLAVVFAGVAVWAMIQFVFLNEYFQGRARHPLADPNSLAALFTLALFPALGWMMAAPGKSARSAAWILSLLLIGGIMSTGSRGAMFALIPALALFLWLARERIGPCRTSLIALAGAAAFLFFLSQFSGWEQTSMAVRVAETLGMNGGRADPSGNRLNIWMAAIGVIRDHWLLGTGIGTFYLYFPEHRLAQDTIGSFHAHSDPLQFWAEMGVLAPLLFYGFLSACAMRMIRAMRAAADADAVRKMTLIAPFCALVAVAVHTHVNFNFYNLSILFGAGFLLAAWFRETARHIEDPVYIAAIPDRTPALAGAALVALPFLFIGALFANAIVGEHLVNRARDHIFRGELEAFAANIDKASALPLGTNYRVYLFALNVPLTALEVNGRLMTAQEKADAYDQAQGYLRRVAALNPRSASAMYYRGKILDYMPPGAQDEHDQAYYYAQALRLDPMHLGARMALAKLHKDKGDIKEARRILDEGLDRQYNDPAAMQYFGQAMITALDDGDAEGQRRAAEKMAQFKRKMERSHAKQGKSLGQHLFGDGDEMPAP